MRQPGLLLGGLYAWIVTMAFGATVADVVYAAQLSGGTTAVRSEVGDFLLGVAAMTALAAIAAIAGSWSRQPARNLFVASLVVVLAGLLTPALLSDIVRDADRALGVTVGPWIRLGEGGLASMLAFIGLWECWRRQ